MIFENEFDSRNSYQNRERERERSKFSTKKKFDENRDNKNKTYMINEKNKSNTIEIEKVFHNENHANEAFYSQKLKYYNSSDEKKNHLLIS